jgi:protease-4
MKNFFTSLLGSFLGTVIALVVVVLIVIGIVAGAVSGVFKSQEKAETVSENAILHLLFDRTIVERSGKNPFENFSFGSLGTEPPIALNDLLADLKNAKTDPKIKGLYLDLQSVSAGMATLEEIRNALIDFKKSNKFIYSYSETYTQKSYYLASVSDKIYLNPAGTLEWKGLSAQIMFYKGLLDKLEISAQIFRHGRWKSAVEPFDLDKMSKDNRDQTHAYVGALWNRLVDGVSQQRKIPVAELNRLADSLLVRTGEQAVQYKLADELRYQEEVYAALNKMLSKKETDKINFITPEAYHKAALENKAEPISKNKIAVIYAVGQIESGEGDDKTIGSERISHAIREARLDSHVKAIVLRVNSPGGSALASDVIWHEMVLAGKAKPVIVSMGDVAASGGYYISCAARRIYAQPNTITGSIGVFGILPNIQKLLNNKLGITIDTVKTNRHSDIGSLYRPVTDEEKKYILSGIEHVYDDFKIKVGEGRKMDTAAVNLIGQGRVWSGTDAKANGLVDELGGLDDAIRFAAKEAKLEKYRIINLPKQKDPFSALFRDFATEERLAVMRNLMGERYEQYENFRSVISTGGVQARMPFDIFFN